MAGARVVYRDVPVVTVPDGWCIDEIQFVKALHMQGQFGGSSLLCDTLLGDDRVQATLGSRTGGLFGQPAQFKAADADKGGKCLAAWTDNWERIAPQSVMSEIIRWAVMMGFCLIEVNWDTSGKCWIPILKPWHAQYIWYRWDTRNYAASTQDGVIDIDPGNGKWVLYAPHGPYRGWIHGAIRPVADKWFIKQLAWRDWARFNERHGLPIIKAKLPAAGDPAQKDRFQQSLATMGQEAVVGLPQNVDGTGYDIELVEARDRGYETFGTTIDKCDAAIVLPIMWQNLTTEVTEGSFAAARVHGGVRQNAIEFDNSTLCRDLQAQLARPFALFNFDDADLAPKSWWGVEPVEDTRTRTQNLTGLASACRELRQAGFEVTDLEALAEGYGVKIKNSWVKAVPVGAPAGGAGGLEAKQEAKADVADEEAAK